MGVVLAVAVVLVVALQERGNRQQLIRRLGSLDAGVSPAILRDRAGAPDAVCPGGSKGVHHLNRFTGAKNRLKELGRVTEERWIYYAEGATSDQQQRARCLPAYGDAELGFDEGGTLQWYRIGDDFEAVSGAR